MTHSNSRPRIAFIQRLCKELPEEKIQEAEANFWAYLEVVKRIAVQQEHAQSDRNVSHIPDWTPRDSER